MEAAKIEDKLDVILNLVLYSKLAWMSSVNEVRSKEFKLRLEVILALIGEKKMYFYFFKRPERYNQEVLSHPFICLPMPYTEGIVLICDIDLYCVIAIFNGTGDMFNR